MTPGEEAAVSVFDAGFSHGAGLFETLRAYRGRVMALPAHVERLNTSAAALGLPVAIDAGQIGEMADELLAANDLSDARLRLTVTPGNVPRPGEAPGEDPSPTVLLAAEALRPYAAELYQHGMRVCICPHRQNPSDPLTGHKTLAYLPRLLAMKDAAAKRCHESLWFTTDHRLAEGSVSNVFIVRDGAVVTPPTNTPLLSGIVRRAVLDLAKEQGIPAMEEAITIETLLAASEVFLTGSIMEVMPVTAIERHTVGSGEPGAITRQLATAYKTKVEDECGAT
ncbi:MAG: aminotransferase class IV [Gemmataceae bacterium]|nr:aminotransferase class IV [Gemmataceae bacterium]